MRRGARLRWPASGVLGPDDRIEIDPELDVERAGPHQLIGQIVLAR